MHMTFPDAARGAAAAAPPSSVAAASRRLLDAAQALQPLLEAGHPFSTAQLREAMARAFGASDAAGAWDWKAAYDACEAAQILLLRRYGGALAAQNRSPQRVLAMWERLAACIPTQTRRSEEGQSLQQFSTPLPLAFVAALAASIHAGDRVLEPSAGTGMLAIHAELAGASLALNELAGGRAELLELLFPAVPITRHDGASIDDRLDAAFVPDIVLMNPPFSATAHVDRPMRGTALRHIASALARLRDGGRLVAIVGANCAPEAAAFRAGFVRLQEQAKILFSAAIAGKVYAKHGTTTSTRLLVIDKVPAADPSLLPASHGEAPDLATLLVWVTSHVPPRPAPPPPAPAAATPFIRGASTALSPLAKGSVRPEKSACVAAGELVYETIAWSPPIGQLGEAIYEPYGLQSLRIAGASPHPTALVQSAAMASVAPPQPSYRPHLPENLAADGLSLIHI